MPSRLVRTGASLLAVGALAGLAIAADAIVRLEMQRIAREEIALSLDLPDADQVESEVIGGSAILQLMLGSLDHVSITVPDVAVGGASGTFHAEIYDLPTNPVQPIPRVYSYIEFDQEAVEAFTDAFVDAPVDQVVLQPPSLRVRVEIEVAERTAAVVVDVEPVTRGSHIVLVPDAVTVGGLRMTPAAFEERFGIAMTSLFDATGFCVDDAMPSTIEVTDVRVANGAVILVFGIEQQSVAELQAPHGRCDP